MKQALRKSMAIILAALILLTGAPLTGFAAPGLHAQASAQNGGVELETDWTVNPATNTIAVYVNFVDAIDLKSWDLVINYDPTIFAYKDAIDGKDAKQVSNCMNNTYTKEFNPVWDADSFMFTGYFKEVLWAAEEFYADSDFSEGVECIVDSDNFQALVIHLTVVDAEKFAAETTAITISEADSYMTIAAEKPVSAKVEHVIEAETPTDAPETGEVHLETDWTVNPATNTIAVYVNFVDAVDLKSWNLIINYDPTIFAYKAAIDGKDAKQVANCMNNAYSKEFNPAWDSDSFSFPGYFKEVLWSAEEFYADSNVFEGVECVVDSDNFQALVIHLTVIDAEKFASESTAITITEADSYMTFAAAKPVSTKVEHFVEVAPPTEVPSTEVPPTEVPTTGHTCYDDDPTIIPPTCTEAGYTIYTCSDCGSVNKDDYTNPTGHTPGAAATCTKEQRCTVCNEVVTEKLAHNYSSVVTAPTCENDGFTTYTCADCGYSCIGNQVSALGHAVGDAVIENRIEATCTVDGSYTIAVYCANCNNKMGSAIHPIAAKGHTPGAAATCTKEQRCTVCNEVVTEKLAHNYSSVVTAPTCENDGFTTYTCTDCGYSYIGNQVSALGHAVGDAVVENRIEATCTVDGSYTIAVYCANCNNKMGAAIHPIAAKGHTPGAAATCTKEQLCTVCGEVLTAKLGHNYNAATVAPTCESIGFTLNTCITCGDTYTVDEIKALGHSWDNGVITTEPTTETEGVKTYTCSVCGTTKTESIEKLQPSFSESEDAILSDNNTICSLVNKTAESLLAQAGDDASLVDKDGNALAADAKVGTGAVLTLADGTKYEIIVPGDTNGDAAITSSDARFALRYAVGLETIAEDSVFALAANVDAGGIASSDARSILRCAVGLDDPTAWFEKIK